MDGDLEECWSLIDYPHPPVPGAVSVVPWISGLSYFSDPQYLSLPTGVFSIELLYDIYYIYFTCFGEYSF